MKFDERGIPYECEDIDHLDKFLEIEDADDYLKRLRDELPWQEVTLRGDITFPHLVFRYGEFERQFRRYEILEELIMYVQEVLEMDVISIWCNLYRNGKDHSPYHQENYNTHVLIISLGRRRKISIREIGDIRSRKDFFLDHGDAFYYSSDINITHENSIPRCSNVREQTINIVFFIDKPYSRRKRHLRYITLLGFGKIPVWFEGPESQFPRDAVATILPVNTSDPYEGILSATRPEFGTPIEIDHTP